MIPAALALLKRIWLPCLLILALLYTGLAIYGKGIRRGDERTNAKWELLWAERDALEANARADAVQSARTEEQRRFAAANEVAKDARAQTTVIDFGVSQLTADVGGLRLEAAKLAESASSTACSTAVADRGQAAARAAMVLSDLLGRCSATLEELAPAYDRARNAGYACERTYDSLTLK